MTIGTRTIRRDGVYYNRFGSRTYTDEIAPDLERAGFHVVPQDNLSQEACSIARREDGYDVIVAKLSDDAWVVSDEECRDGSLEKFITEGRIRERDYPQLKQLNRY